MKGFSMTSPSRKTIKRLYAVSGNRCAFPKCQISLTDNLNDKVVVYGKICHIKSRKARGARYDPTQSDKERNAFENLLLMCPNHHDVIDSDPESFTVSRLKNIKTKHEALYAGGGEPSDDIAKQFLLNMTSSRISNGSIIFTHQQMGGQVAHNIVNIGKQSRQISQASANALVSELRKYPSENFAICSVFGDPEVYDLAQRLEVILKLAGWTCFESSQGFFASPLPRGVIIETTVSKPSLVILLNWLKQVGLDPRGNLVPDRDIPKIVVGPAVNTT